MTAQFYDQLAPYYHLLYGDWERSVALQGEALSRLLGELGVASGSTVLDAASGIGTQTIGLLQQGYQVTASDVSPGAIERLKSKLSRRSLHAPARVDDLRTLQHAASQSIERLLALLTEAGFVDAHRRDDLMFQPVLVGRRPRG